jgi:methyl-accepting chemotaxis protein
MKMFYDLRIGAKLFAGFAVLLLLTAFLGIFSILQLARVNQTAYELGTNWMPSVNAAMGIKERLSRIRTQELQIVLSNNVADVERYQGRLNGYTAELKKYEADFVKLLSAPSEKAIFDEYGKRWDVYWKLSGDISALAHDGKNAEALTLLRGESSKVNAELLALADKIVAVNLEGGATAYRFGESIYASSRLMIIAVLAASITLGLILAYAIARIVTRPLQQAVRFAQSVAAGDLTCNIESNTRDETGQLLQALREMNGNLLRVVSEVRSSTDMIAAASTEIANGNMDLSNRTESQASSLEETAASMEELTSTVKANSSNAQQADELSQSASAVAQKGGVVVSQVVATMSDINQSSKKIVDIISVIDGIAFQTNILALNAAVEAARAGEQGRGFAVVASEVRSLAQRSASAAREIKALIVNSVEKVDRGSQLVDDAGRTMNEVVDSVGRVTHIMSEITAASQEQGAGIAQINDAIIQMDQVTQQNAALVEQAAAAAAALKDLAANLTRVVGVFKLNDRDNLLTVAAPGPMALAGNAMRRRWLPGG